MDFKRLIEYDLWANERIFEAMQDVEEHEEQCKEMHRLFAHILGAQEVWISRIKGNKPSLAIWPDLSQEKMEELLTLHPKKLMALASRVDETIQYENSRGELFSNTIEEIIMHLTIHGQHHRAQIARQLRQSDITPPATDFIFFLRK